MTQLPLGAEVARKSITEITRYGLRIQDNRLAGIDVREVLKVLTTDNQAFFGLKEVVLAGLSAWLLTPKNEKAISDALIVRAAAGIAAAEKKVRQSLKPTLDGKKLPKKSKFMLAQLMLPATAKYQPFMTEIYSQVGGMAAVVGAAGRAEETGRKQEEAATAIRQVIKLMPIIHYSAIEFGTDNRAWKRPSFQQAVVVAKDARLFGAKGPRTGSSEPRIRAHLAGRTQTLPFLYAASLVRCDGGTLLDHILHKPTYAMCKPYLKQWFGMTRYLTHHVFQCMAMREKYVELDWLPELVAPTPSLGSDQIEKVRGAFRK